MTGWQATVLTLFPEMFPGPLRISLLGKALEKNLPANVLQVVERQMQGVQRNHDQVKLLRDAA